MKFLRFNNEDNTSIYKFFTCEVCGYQYSTKYANGKEEILKGDKPIEIYPFFSLRKENGEHKTLCSCPKCSAVQVLNPMSEDEVFI